MLWEEENDLMAVCGRKGFSWKRLRAKGNHPPTEVGHGNWPHHTSNFFSMRFPMVSGKGSALPRTSRDGMSSARLFEDVGTQPRDHEPG